MQLEADVKVLTVDETLESRQFWLEQEIAKDLGQELALADVLIVPLKDFRPGAKYVFHQDTPAFLNYLKGALPEELVVEICVADDDYQEIALHSNFLRLSTLVVSYAVAPLVIGLLTNYVYDELKAKPTDTVELSIVVEDDQCKAFKFNFKGEAKDLNVLADKVGQMARDCKEKSKVGTKQPGNRAQASSSAKAKAKNSK